MKQMLKAYGLPLLVLAGGLLGALLRWILYTTGVDERGLLVSFHFAEILLWVVTLGTGVLLVLETLPLQQANKYRFNFPRSAGSAVCCFAAAVGVGVTAIQTLGASESTLTLVCGILGLFSAVSLAFLGYCRWKGVRPSLLFTVLICAFLIVRLVCCYQIWSSDPQVQDYIFPLLANIGATIACYYSAAFSEEEGNRKLHTLFHLAAGYCALVSLPCCDSFIFYLSVAVWMFSDLCNLTPLPRQYRNRE